MFWDSKVLEMILDNQRDMKESIKGLEKGQQEILLARAEEKGKMKIIAAIVSAIVSGIAIAGYTYRDYFISLFS